MVFLIMHRFILLDFKLLCGKNIEEIQKLYLLYIPKKEKQKCP